MSKHCPTCDGKLRYFGEDDLFHDCDCNKQLGFEKHYFAANIGKRYHTLGIDDFLTEDAVVIRVIVEDYLADFEDNFAYGLGLVFYGGLGTGKTLLACHILKELIKQGRHCYFVQFDDLIDTWGKRWSDENAAHELNRNMKRADVLVVDDLSTDKRNIEGFLSSGLESVVRYRYNNSLPTIVTTNLSQDRQYIEFPRVFSLLSAINVWVEMKTKDDYRPNEYRERLFRLRDMGARLPL